jgi:tight adherence protein B
MAPDRVVAVLAAGAAVGVFAWAGFLLLGRAAGSFRARYVEGTALTLDAMYLRMAPVTMLYLALLAALVAGGLAGCLSGSPLAAGAAACAAAVVPEAGLRLLKRRRDRLFNRQLVDALPSLANSLRAGFSLPQAFERLHREMPDPMRQEIRLLAQEIRVGVPLDQALENLRERMPVEDLDLVVTAIGIVREVGGNLSGVFETIARTVRDRHRVEGRIRALTAQGRAQAVVMCALPFLVGGLLAAVQPEMFRLLTDTRAGWLLILLILVLETLGVLMIRRIIRIGA